MMLSSGRIRISLVKILEFALLAILLFVVGKPLLALFTHGTQVVLPPSAAPAPVHSRRAGAQDFSILGRFSPFHRDRTEIPPLPTPETLGDAPETDLNLKVFGMRADFGGESSSAIIQTPDGRQATYYIGDEIIPGVKLKQVDIDYIILERNGNIERLSRQGKEGSGQSSGKASGANFAALLPSGTKKYKAIELINNVRFYPAREGREIIGYRVIPRRGGSLKKYGFENNDIIVSVNGENLAQSHVNLPAILKNLKQARYASFQIIRNDVPMSVEVNLQ